MTARLSEPLDEDSARARCGRPPSRRLDRGLRRSSRRSAPPPAQLKQQTASRAGADRPQPLLGVHAGPARRPLASIFSLARRCRTELQTPNVILQLNQLAIYSGISFDQITPGHLDRHGDDRSPTRSTSSRSRSSSRATSTTSSTSCTAAESRSGRARTPARPRTHIRRERPRASQQGRRVSRRYRRP